MKLTDFRTKPPGKVGVKAKNEIEIDFDVGLALRGVTIDPPNAANLRACEFSNPRAAFSMVYRAYDPPAR